MENETVTMNLHVKKFTSQVLGVIKEKFNLKDKSDALNKFADIYGEEFVDKEVKDEVILEVIKASDEHIKKHGLKSMSIGELRKLCGVK